MEAGRLNLYQTKRNIFPIPCTSQPASHPTSGWHPTREKHHRGDGIQSATVSQAAVRISGKEAEEARSGSEADVGANHQSITKDTRER